jgi:hypothetical protein
MVRTIITSIFAFFLMAGSALADSQGSATGGTAGTQSTGAGCINQTPSLSANQQATLSCNSSGALKVDASGSGGGSVTLLPSATVGLTTSRCTTACASVLVSGAHGLYGGSFSATTAGWLLIYDATSCSADGTVTPKKAFAYPVANTTIGFSWSDLPVVQATGIAACFSTTGPYTAAASTTAFISVDYK